MRRRKLDVVFEEGRRCSGKWLKLLVHDECGITFSGKASGDTVALDGSRKRLAIMVRKSAGGAAVRNKIRRRIREIYRETARERRRVWNTVVLVKDQAAGASFRELQCDFEVLIRKMGSDDGKVGSIDRR